MLASRRPSIAPSTPADLPPASRMRPVLPPAKRMFTLDVLRGVAVLLVMVYHMGIADHDRGEDGVAWFREIASRCWVGVDLFFVISGFLISGLLFAEIDKTGGLRLGRFWLRRGLKIWPCYFAAYGTMIALTSVVDLRRGAYAAIVERLRAAVPNVFLVQNYARSEDRWPNSWSLAVEEHFYLVLPLVIALASRRRFRHFLPACAAFCLVVLGLRILDAGSAHPDAYFPTHLRADSLCAGVAIGFVNRYRKDAFQRLARLWPLVPIALAILAAALMTSKSPFAQSRGDYLCIATIGFTGAYLAFGMLVWSAAAHPRAGETAPAPVRLVLEGVSRVGVYSYTIYLAQAILPRTPGFALVNRVARAGIDSPWTSRFVFLVASIAVGVAISHVVERPVLRLREKLWPPRSAALAAAERAEEPRAAA